MYRDYVKGRVTNKTIKYIPLVQFNKTIKYFKDHGKQPKNKSKFQHKELKTIHPKLKLIYNI